MSQVPVFFLLSLPIVGAFALFALGIVVIHQSSKVLNLAHGAMAMVPAFVTYSLVQTGVPAGFAVVLGVATGVLIGVGVERIFVRGLRRQGPTGQTVGTIAALGLLLGFALKVWGTTPRTAIRVFPDGGIHVAASLLRWGQIGLLGVAALCTAALFAVFAKTDLGLAMRSAADNRRAASLMGIDSDLTAMVSWGIGGALAAIAGILLAPVSELHPVNLTLLVLPAFVAALMGGLSSLPGAAIGSAVVGIVLGMVPAIALIPGVGSFATQVGAPQLVLTLIALVVMASRGDRYVGALVGVFGGYGSSGRSRNADRVRTLGSGMRAMLGIGGVGFLLLLPLFAPSSIIGNAIQAGIILLVASSLVLLTGWVGQISLGQASFVGIGAFSTALIVNKTGLQFPLTLPVAALISAAVAAIIGLVALRVRGLYLAVATLIVLWMSNEYLFRSSWLVGVGGSARVDVKGIGRSGGFPYFDLTERRPMFYVVLAVAAATMWALSNLRDSKTGRAFFAVRGSEVAAAALGVDITRYKLLAFASSGVLAGIAGNLLITSQGAASPQQFDFTQSLFFLAVAVVGGIRSLGGAAAAAVLFAALSEVFFRFQVLAGWLPIVSAGLLSGVLLAYPGGIAAAFAPLGAMFRGRHDRTFPTREPREVADSRALPDRSTPTLLQMQNVVVRFGGLTAVDKVSLEVHEGEIVGLIGPNGAGKTTTFNAISGLAIPAEGTVSLFGNDVTQWPVHKRAALGVARTFQVVQLFSELTIFENLLVATHLQNPSGAFSHLVVTEKALRGERAAHDRVSEIVSLLNLQDIAERRADGLSLGTLRMVEVARAIVTGAKLIMLDEPASGLDNAETDKLAEHLLAIRGNLDVSILLIEHDVQMVTRVSDYMYVINRGAPLAEGTSTDVQRDQAVIAAYLGEPAEVLEDAVSPG